MLIPELCRLFYELGWVTGTGGGISLRHGLVEASYTAIIKSTVFGNMYLLFGPDSDVKNVHGKEWEGIKQILRN